MNLYLNEYRKVKLKPRYVIYEIPREWKVLTLGELTKKISNGLSYQHDKNQKDGMPITRIETISNEIIDEKRIGYVEKPDVEVIKKYQLKEGDILFSHINSLKHVGKTAFYENIPKVLLHGMNLLRITTNHEKIIPKYLYYFLKFEPTRNRFRSISNTAINQVSINTSQLNKFQILVPTLSEQQKITSILSYIDSLIQHTQKEIEQTQRFKKGLMQRLLTKGIGHTKFKNVKWLFRKEIEIPEEWEICKVEQLIKNKKDVKTGPFGSSLKKETFVPQGYKVYGQENVIPDDFTIGNYYITKDHFERMKEYEIKPNDILISLVGTHGKISIVPENIELGIINPRLLRIRFDNSKALPTFMKILLNSNLIEVQVMKFVHGLTIEILNTSILRKILFPIPKIPEQQKIASILSNVDYLIQKQQEYKSQLETLKKGLMQKLLTGQISVKI